MPPASGKADVFFKQIIALSTAGFRVVAVSGLKPTISWLLWLYLYSLPFLVQIYAVAEQVRPVTGINVP